MSQRKKILYALKSCLKAKGITYKQLAEQIDMSEVSVKRIFSSENISLERLEKICNCINVDFITLIEQAAEAEQRITQLSLDQEQYLMSDEKRLLVAYLALNGWSFDEIISHYTITEHECIGYLADLDKINLIELQVNNRIKRRVAPNFAWRTDGPIKAFYERQVKSEFFASEFNAADEALHFLSGNLSSASRSLISKKFNSLVNEFNELCKLDTSLPHTEKEGTSCVLALRSWEFSVFAKFLK